MPPPEPQPPPPPRQAQGGRGAHSLTAPAAAAKSAPGGAPASMPSVAAQLAQLVPRSQILIQPDAPLDVMLKNPTPIPTILRWSPPDLPTKKIMAAPLQKSIIANLRPSVEPPNREVAPADFKMSSTAFATKAPTLPPSTTSPVVVRAPTPAEHIPETASKQAVDPTPARIMSLSNLQVKEGPVTVPLANSPGRPSVSETLATGPAVNAAGTGQGNPASKLAGSGSSQGDSTAQGKVPNGNGTAAQGTGKLPGGTGTGPQGTVAQNGTGTGTGAGTQAQNGMGSAPGAQSPNGTGTSTGVPSGSGFDLPAGTTVTRFHLPKDGQFGVVVVGSTLAEQYPETVGLWSGRLVYTVYLHMGSGKAWILQYSLPQVAQATSAGSARPEAPWPYDIVQPHLAPSDFTADALMIHGFVNLAGKFERLGVVFPAEFPEAKLVLSVLQQWQFRPARQNGQLAPVEVLLIIPEEE